MSLRNNTLEQYEALCICAYGFCLVGTSTVSNVTLGLVRYGSGFANHVSLEGMGDGSGIVTNLLGNRTETSTAYRATVPTTK